MRAWEDIASSPVGGGKRSARLWLVPTVLVVVAVVLFAVTFAIDWAAYYAYDLPFWLRTETADAGRQV